MQRRSFLKGAGVLTIAVVGGGVWRAWDRGVFSVGEGPAFEPWKDWRNAKDSPLALVSAAILAASPHNTQPWLFKVSNSTIELYIDKRRNTGALDPYLREEHIAMGCALENLMLAAPANGYAANATVSRGKLGPIPAEPRPELLASVELAPGNRSSDELYDAIPHRHTNRSAYEPHKPLPTEFLEALGHLPPDENVKLFLFTNDADRKKITAISSVANQELYSDPAVLTGTRPWYRLQWSAVEKHRDGLEIDDFGLPPATTAMVKIMPQWMLEWIGSHSAKEQYSNLMLSAPLIGFIAVRDRYDQQQCLLAGRTWQRLHLFATVKGIAARPDNEAVEMVDHQRWQAKPASYVALLNEITGDATWQPTFVFIMGYPTLTAQESPRRPVDWVTL
jgi:hypothetical protein